jgi:hypothetical protein
MVVVPKAPIIIVSHPIVNNQPISTNPFGSLGHSPGYNVQSIPMASSPFSYGMPNFTSQFSNSILVAGPNASIGLRGTTPPYTPFSFGGNHVPQMTPTVGGFPPLNLESNRVASGWNNQPGRQASAHVPSFTPTSSASILTNTFFMTNPPLSSVFTPVGGWFHTLGNPQLKATPARGSFYNPHQNIPIGMMPKQPLMNHHGGGPYNPRQGHGAYQNPGWAAIPQPKSFQGAWGQMSQPRLPFLATLNLPDLSKLMNNPVCHDPTWPPVPTNLPSNILKFEGKNGEDPGDHVTTFHLWFSSNSLNDDSIQLRWFQCTLMGVSTKWYIELPRGAYETFSQMVLVFLNHFQLSVCYDVGLELLSTLRQDKATHISDHIQEWRRRKRLIKNCIPLEFLLEWFLKSLQPPILKDVPTSRVTYEEEAIFKAQQLNLIYSQSGMLYKILPDASRSNYDPRKNIGPHVDGIVGSANV